MAEPLVVVGAGGFGRETLDVADAINRAAGTPTFDILGVVDDAPSEANLRRLDRRGVPWLGPLAATPARAKIAIGVGAPHARHSLAGTLASKGYEFATLVHPTAIIGSMSSIGLGSIVCGGVCVGTNVSLGRHVHLNPAVVVGHDTTLADFVSINPNATVSGECEIDEGVLVGAGAVVLQQMHVGRMAIVGAAACVTASVPPSITVKGVPAR